MTKVIAIANQKGGVGKTTTTLIFGSELAERGNTVLMIDMDSQANLSIACGMSQPDEEYTIADVLISVMNGDEVTADMMPIYPFKEGLMFMPSSVMLSNVNLMLVQAIAREYILKRVIAVIKERYDFDYILIDCAPSLSVDLLNALTAADEVLIVSAPASFSAAGSGQLIKTINKISENINPDLKICGVLFNRVNERTTFARDIIAKMREAWEDQIFVFDQQIAGSIRVDESQAMGVSVADYDRKNRVAKDFSSFTEEYLTEVQKK